MPETPPIYTGPERRRRPGVTPRLVLILFGLACVYMTAVFVVGEVRNHHWAEQRDAAKAQTAYENQLDSCERGLIIRRELNKRADFHRRDARNLRDLSATLANTRRAEARFYDALGRRFGIRPALEPLVERLREAAELDRAIRDRQTGVTFAEFGTPPCEKTVAKP